MIKKGVAFRNLGLAVIDEQHRFGVMQRSTLMRKALNPDVLIMTATPIPRTLALTLYGNLDYSVIDELPPDRRPVKTLLFHADQKEPIYRSITEEVKKGRQVYIVYPVIEESEKTDLRSASMGKKGFERVFPDLSVGLLHGRMKTPEREQMMTSFKNGEIDILVCTTVIEVGVDVPNATLMIIIHAERWGPREIDLDILFHNDTVFSDDDITVPHKDLLNRDFVLVPLCEIAPDLIHPLMNKKISKIIIFQSKYNESLSQQNRTYILRTIPHRVLI